ncbi:MULTISPECIES: DNA endonuclease SmrA [Oceanospirillaceae]|jgi:DNA-nicking Smr family endonuclease|uniref:DNA endonuclease SmrA n=1 Tax=Oceanospirillaceae TaxID=135620 RepID=UPI000C6792C9|nr:MULTISPECIES: DNA endonuclease SmrA [Thalassolituus]MAY14114.1 DNA endonuclease SmrA [Oceanospirillaceae bacterium]MBU2039513.1 DNA endonuclease SmrA [Gammaproteobacteria bacterium]PIQ40979.1 MAG: DNA endonuclease SmrA [Thalassolituus sp. CG17_big_fil_post_rev_8_21_14_2_50_53_8]MCB2385990.1 DNA endonuclease SmrA [Thalassolituus alkanivorans]MCB2422617.1 DNA endonuclease SmrA [Thalassolituus alkanivorans]|tara:strand:- start:537 stop:1136 length:600 start_codon:yes stop_codon:yes gene_type:complete
MSDTNNDPEEQLFLQEMQGVKPLQTKERVELRKAETSQVSAAARRQAAQQQPEEQDGNRLQTSEVKRVGPHDVIGYKRPGIQDGVFRKLRLGKYETEARLDLHRRTIDEARRELYRFIQDCMAHDIRSVLVLPGKGDRNINDPAVLKSYLVHWLEELDEVQAYHTAQPHHGGAGAFYVLLRKSERKKQAAREQFSKGRL